jgi:hypothetical protein
MNLSWGFSIEGLEFNGYRGPIGEVWRAELELMLKKCIDIGLLVSYSLDNLAY